MGAHKRSLGIYFPQLQGVLFTPQYLNGTPEGETDIISDLHILNPQVLIFKYLLMVSQRNLYLIFVPKAIYTVYVKKIFFFVLHQQLT